MRFSATPGGKLAVCALLAGQAYGLPELEAAPVRVGSEFQLSADTDLFVDAVDLDTAADGGFVVVWNSRVPVTQDRGVFGRRFDARANAFDGDMRIDATRDDTYIGASAPMVGVNDEGAFAVTWFWDDLEVLARTYDRDGSALGPESVVHSDASGDHLYPDIAAVGSEFVAVWERNTGSNHTSDVAARRLTSTGTASGSQFYFSGAFPDQDHHPRVATRADGSFVAAWMYFESGVASRVLARLYAADDQALSDTIVVTEHTTSVASRPVVETAASGDFVVAWRQRDGNDDPGRIVSRRFDKDGVALADEFVVATEPAGLAGYPSVGMFADGRFVVAWSQYNVTDPKIYGRLFEANGTPSGDRFLVGDLGASRPAVATDDNAGFVVVWAGTGGRGQRFTLAPVCADADADGQFLARDALLVLRGSVGLETCVPCLCNTSGSGTVVATDALRTLHTSVGLEVELNCPACL
jgi:hypothetical protein